MTLAKQTSEQDPTTEPSRAPRAAHQSFRSAEGEQKTYGYQINEIIRGIDLPDVRDIVGSVFQNLLALIECLDLIECHLRQVDSADETFALFEVIHDEARSLVDFIRTDALNNQSMSEELVDTLDGITFALSHDLHRVFEPNSRAPLADNTKHVLIGKLYRAHDVLTNCLQQSTITLAMVFDSECVGTSLFNNSDMRYRQSLQLCEDISALIQLIETAEETKTATALWTLSAGIEKFRQDSLECLMYSDWPQFESFCERIALPEESRDLESTLHQFRCYLETLLGQVRMRAVLANVFPVQFGAGDNCLLSTFADEPAQTSDEQVVQTSNPLALAG